MTKEFDARNERKSRSVCAAMAEAADTGKRVLTERERAILDMWPRFEDTGDPVMVGDAYIDGSGDCVIIVAVRICDVCVDLVGEDGFLTGFKPGERVKRPAPEVLDADGVPIHEGDTVWIIPAVTDTPDEPHEVKHINRWGEVLLEFHFERSTGVKGEYLTHTHPDSWERLEEDAGEDPFRYCKTVGKRLDTFDNAEVFKSADIVRRAKKLAKVEVD